MAEWKNPRTHPHVQRPVVHLGTVHIYSTVHTECEPRLRQAQPQQRALMISDCSTSHLVPGDFQILLAEIYLLQRQCGTRRRLTRRGVDYVVGTMQAPSRVVRLTANRGSDLRGTRCDLKGFMDRMRQQGVKMDVFFFGWTVYHRLTASMGMICTVHIQSEGKAIDLGIDGASGDVDY